MNENTNTPETVPAPLPSEVTLPVEHVSVINMDEIKTNSVIVIKTDMETIRHKVATISQILAPYAKKLREKGVSVMFMPSGDEISEISEEQMNAAGWEKKAKSLIIKPFSK